MMSTNRFYFRLPKSKIIAAIIFISGFLFINLNAGFAAMIIKFEGIIQGNAVYFHWELLPGSSYRLLEVEKSTDSVLYSGCLAFNANNTKLFAWDKNLIAGLVYYRLKLTEYNGAIEYSVPVKLNITKDILTNTLHNFNNRLYDAGTTQNSNSKKSTEVIFLDLNGNVLLKVWNEHSFYNPPAHLLAGIQAGHAIIAILIKDGYFQNRKLYQKK